jgi:ABC-type nitrate/sulfonate/bicarbonate transport system ATPase subunit
LRKISLSGPRETKMPNVEVAKNPLMIEADLLTWMTVHGNILLALRHPENTGETRAIAQRFVDELGRKLVEGGIINQAELDYCRQEEEKAASGRQ